MTRSGLGPRSRGPCLGGRQPRMAPMGESRRDGQKMADALTLERLIRTTCQACRIVWRIGPKQRQMGTSWEKSYEFPDIEPCRRTLRPEKWMTIF